MSQTGKGEELAVFSLLAVLATTFAAEVVPAGIPADGGVSQQPLSARIDNILRSGTLGKVVLSGLDAKQPLIAQFRN